MPGRKPKPPAVRDAMGNPGRRPIPRVDLPETGGAVAPEFLGKRPRALELWEEYAPALTTLGTLRKETSHTFAMWCWLTAQFERKPDAMTASKISNIRALASMLGMDPSAIGKFRTPTSDDKDPAEEFFTGPRAVNA